MYICVFMHACMYIYMWLYMGVSMYTRHHVGSCHLCLSQYVSQACATGLVFARPGVRIMGKHWNAASNNGIGGVGHADKVGVWDFDSASQDSNSSCDSGDEVSHGSTVSRAEMSNSEYQSAVINFRTLENQWLNEKDPLQQQTLYKSIYDAEIAFAVRIGVYSHLITGNQEELSVAKNKTRNRMQARLKYKCCIGVPVQARVVKRQKNT